MSIGPDLVGSPRPSLTIQGNTEPGSIAPGLDKLVAKGQIDDAGGPVIQNINPQHVTKDFCYVPPSRNEILVAQENASAFGKRVHWADLVNERKPAHQVGEMGVKCDSTVRIKLFDPAQSRRGHQDIPERTLAHDMDLGPGVGRQAGDLIAHRSPGLNQ